MITAEVCSPVIPPEPNADPLSPLAAWRVRLFDIPGVVSHVDVTGANPPVAPNVVVCKCVFTPEAFDAVIADAENYYVNWSVDNG